MKRKACWIIVAMALTCLVGCTGKGGKDGTDASTEISANASTESEAEESSEETYLAVPMTINDKLQKAIANGLVILENGNVTHGKDVWSAFYEKVSRGEAADVMIAWYYVPDPDSMSPELYEEEKDDYSSIFYSQLSYDGSMYTLRSARDTTNGYYIYEVADMSNPITTWKYLKKYTGEPKMPNEAKYKTYEKYVLVDDDNVTWDEIEWGMYSDNPEDYISHEEVYCEYTMK